MTDERIERSWNLDYMTPEGVGFALETLLAEGALDAFTTAIGMKKSRPGIMLTCLCRPEEGEKMARLLLRHTTTLGIRETRCKRYTLERSLEERETEYGPVRVKRSEGFGVSREKPEYEDLCRIARERGLSLEEVRKLIK